jgi:acyl-CoA hydrolase
VKTLDISRIGEALHGLPSAPRVVVTGNFGTPWTILSAIDATLPTFRLYAINAQKGIPDREGVILETSFVGAAMRKNPRSLYYPSRLSLVPRLFASTLPPDVVVLHTTTPRDGTISLGVEVNILPAAVEAARARGGRVVIQMNPRMPYTYGDAVLKLEDVDYAVEVDEPLSIHPPPAIF